MSGFEEFIRAIHSIDVSDDELLIRLGTLREELRVFDGLEDGVGPSFCDAQRELVRALAWMRRHRPLAYERRLNTMMRCFAACSADVLCPQPEYLWPNF
jgi:hypothetical protein